MPDLVAGTDIVLGNEEDAWMVLGIKPEGVDITSGHIDADAYLSVSQQFMKKYPRCKKFITTLRGSISANHNSWTGVLYDGSTMFKAQHTYQITHIVDRVGGGDSFMGALIYGLLSWPDDDQKALDFAVAASCLKHTIYGDYNQVSVEEVEKLMRGDASGRVTR
jgi:2-dehydro-3-deoxygluconokinase